MSAIISANLVVAKFGPRVSIITAFVFIGLDLTSRDSLHELWHKKGLYQKMGLLIIGGSVLSYILNQDTWRIALASCVAFFATGICDAVIYGILHEKARILKVNGSNVGSAFADSLIFPTIAFGGFLPLITLGQFGAKILGGFVWFVVLQKLRWLYNERPTVNIGR